MLQQQIRKMLQPKHYEEANFVRPGVQDDI